MANTELQGFWSRAGPAARSNPKFRATTDSIHKYPVAENVLNRDFQATKRNKLRLTDITYIHTGSGWLYLAAVLDRYSRRIVGQAVESRMTKESVCRALKMAIDRRQPGKGLIHHSDRGSPYASKDYQELIKRAGMIPSMSRKGNCWDKTPMESFFHTLKVALVHHWDFETREEAKREIIE